MSTTPESKDPTRTTATRKLEEGQGPGECSEGMPDGPEDGGSSKRAEADDEADDDDDVDDVDSFLDASSNPTDVDGTDDARISAPAGGVKMMEGETTDASIEEDTAPFHADYNAEASFYQSADENLSEVDEEDVDNVDEDHPKIDSSCVDGDSGDGVDEPSAALNHEGTNSTGKTKDEDAPMGSAGRGDETGITSNESASLATASSELAVVERKLPTIDKPTASEENRSGFDAGDKQDDSPFDTSAYTMESDLSRPDRKIWIVTTAAMPWRTGTAVNPLLRALYLAKGRPEHSVTLLVPWLDDSRNTTTAKAHQTKLYGQVFAKPEDQEAWIRDYSRTRCGCDAKDEALLRIRFWKGVYHDGFGSIFPAEDICALIPKEEADVAILEEPEHLNWFRVPKAVADEVRSAAARVVDKKPSQDEDTESETYPGAPSTQEQEQPPQPQLDRDEQLGWKTKFRHVVGVLHTNYAAYIRQYGMGTSLLTAPALNALSALVVRAYCHRVIRLSNCLPSLDAKKEVTENIHGVRSEFLAASEGSDEARPSSPDVAPVYFIGKLIWAKGFDMILELQQAYREATGSYFAMDVYGGGNDEKAIRRAFFGRHGSRKLVTRDECGATNTDDQAEDQVRDDSSGSKRASEVFTRSASLRKQLVEVQPNTGAASAEEQDGGVELVFAGGESLRTRIVLEDQTSDVTASSLMTGSFTDEAASTSSAPVIIPSDVDDDDNAVPDSIASKAGLNDDSASKGNAASLPRQKASFFHVLGDLSGKTVSTGVETAEAGLQLMENVVQSLFGGRSKDLNYNHLDCSSSSSSSSVSGDSETEDAAGSANSGAGIDAPETTTAKPDETLADAASETTLSRAKPRRPNPFGFVPPRARFKWRRHPLPARFLGVQDHIVVRDLPKQTVFLNMSTTEVLCTTTAEALAMGKFAVIPKHPSNEFFYDFPNCLAYEDLEECVDKMVFALSHAPEPLSSNDAHRLSWEGATERLYRAARVSVAEAEEYKLKYASDDEKAARLHVDGTTHSQNLRNFLNDKLLFDL